MRLCVVCYCNVLAPFLIVLTLFVFLYYFVHWMCLCVVCYCIVSALFLIVLTLCVFCITLYTGCVYVLFVIVLC
jgi:hypothetical protein